MSCAHCETMRITLDLLGNILEKILPAGQGRDQCVALCRGAARDGAGDFLLRRSEAAEEVIQAVNDDIRSTGPFKINPSGALQKALAKHSEMKLPTEQK